MKTVIPVYRPVLADNKVTLQMTEETLPVYSKKEIERKAYKFLINRIKKRPVSIPRVVDFIKEYDFKKDKFKHKIEEVVSLFSQEDLNRKLKQVAKEFTEFNGVEDKEYIVTNILKDVFFYIKRHIYDDYYSDIGLDFYAVPYDIQKKYKFVRLHSISKFYRVVFLVPDNDKNPYIVLEDYKNNSIKPFMFLKDYTRNFSHPISFRIPKIIFEDEISFIRMKKRHIRDYVNSEIFLLDPKTFKVKLPLNFSAYITLEKRDFF
jgi:hypothetical protein